MTKVSRPWVISGLATGGFVCVLAIVLIFARESNPQVSDRTLIENFQSNRENFEKLIGMAYEDANVRSFFDDMVILDNHQMWRPGDPNQFSSQRWEEYQGVFRALGSEHQLTKESDVFLIPASVETTDLDENYGEYRIRQKGYAYSRVQLSDEGSLDSLGVADLGRTYRKIADHWYLYHDCGTSKPE